MIRKGEAVNSIRCLAPLALCLSGLALGRGADRVLVPGDPPLTQEVVDLYQQMWEWYCDVKLTPEEHAKLAIRL